jgi:2-polyprenyl-6-methoxyphenol hydroxylase-like FAD-dependent oxidoreductase
VRVYFSGGRTEQADILIGGDGVRSSVRGQVAPEIQPIYAGYYIWRGAPNEADLDPETLRTIYPLFTSICQSSSR